MVLLMPECLQQNSQFFRCFPRRRILYKIRDLILPFSFLFASILNKHSCSEFEIQIRQGDLTPSSRSMLEVLGEDFKVLQYKENIRKIIENSKDDVKVHTLFQLPYIFSLFDVLEDELVKWFEDIIIKEQKKCLKNRREKNIQLCREKITVGSTIYNFTNKELSKELQQLLQHGLNEVPILDTSVEVLVNEMKAEVLQAAKNLFHAEYSSYPHVSRFSTFDQSLMSIVAQCKSNSGTVHRLILLRDNFVENLPFFLMSLQNKAMKAKNLIEMLPDDMIISPSDKQVGISILPHSWFIKQYEVQVLKGGHELIKMTEDQCLAMLLKKISEFRNNCSANQKKFLVKHWPKKSVDKPRIGVLKLVPKVYIILVLFNI